MHRHLKTFEETQIEKINKFREGKTFCKFRSGCTVKVNYKILDEDSKESRNQSMTGVVLRLRNNMSSSTFTVKRIKDQEGSYTKTFMLYSPMIDSIELVRKGKVRRAKIYYLKALYGKSARIKEKR